MAGRAVALDLAETASRMVRLPDDMCDESTAAFKSLRAALLKVSASHKEELDVVLCDIEEKERVLGFLLRFYEARRLYRSQVIAVLRRLLQAASWRRALEGDAALLASLPDDLRSAAREERRKAGDAETAVGRRDVDRQAAPVSASRAAYAPQAGHRQGAAGAADVLQARALTDSAAQSLRQELADAVGSIARSQPHHDKGGEFRMLRQPLQRASQAPEKQLRDILENLEPKVVVLRFLAELHAASKVHQQQVEATLRTLARVGCWRRELCRHASLLESMSEDLRNIAGSLANEVCGAGADVELRPEPPKFRASPSADACREADTAHAAGRAPAGAPRVSDDDVRRAIEAARRGLERPSLRAAEDVFSAHADLEALRREVSTAHSGLLQLLDRCRGAPAAAASDDAIELYISFARSVAHAMGSCEVDVAATVGALERKGDTLTLLLELIKKRPRYQSRMMATLKHLMGASGWKEACEADVQLGVALDTAFVAEASLVRFGGGLVVDLKRRAQEVLDRGGVGALSLDVKAAHDLVNTRLVGGPDPYVLVTLGGESWQTGVQKSTLNPEWREGPSVFEVRAHSMELAFHVLDFRGVEEDALMGHFRMTASLAAGETRQRYRLLGVPRGELEVELRYEGEPKPDEANESVMERAFAKLMSGAARREVSEIVDTELVCLNGHPITKRKDGLRWHQVLSDVEHRCSCCNDVVPATSSRWRCHFHCDFDVCEACYSEAFGGPPSAVASTGSASRESRRLRRAASLSASTRPPSASPRDQEAASAAPSARRASSVSRLARARTSTAAAALTTGLLPVQRDACLADRKADRLGVRQAVLPADGIEHRVAEATDKTTVFYAVDVVPSEPDGKAWRVMRRYNDFSNLADRLGHRCRCLQEAPFPGKSFFSMGDSQIEERRAALQSWLCRVLSEDPRPEEWAPQLYGFFHAGRPPTGRFPPHRR